jgi:hypothetical protein
MLHYKNKDGFMFEWVRYGDVDNDAPPEDAWQGINVITLEWFDKSDAIIDAGMDAPTVWGMSQVYVEPIDYIDLLAVDRPAEEFYRITDYGNWVHPGMHAMPDLDRKGYW